MSRLAPTLEAFFTTRLALQQEASPATVASYRDTIRLLVRFASERTRRPPQELDLADLDAPLIGAFLEHLERQRNNSARTRNARLAAIRALFGFAALSHPEHGASIQRVLAIPQKRFERAVVCFLTRPEVEALLAAPDRSCWCGRRDHALLMLAVHTGLRLGELTGLRCTDVVLSRGAHVRCLGKGRKERVTPLGPDAVAALAIWLDERQGDPADPLFPSRRGGPLSSDAVQSLVARHADVAGQRCPSLGAKHVTPHVLRHTCAMLLREGGVDISTIALWLGHEQLSTVQIYLHADLAMKERALALAAPPGTPPGRYRPPDALLAFLDSL
ncbi:MAG: tyrosine-type recombinase/integrase [Acidimicrobiales bacterium]